MIYFKILIIFCIILHLQACVVGSVINATAETVEAGVKLTGTVIETAVDVIIPEGDEEED